MSESMFAEAKMIIDETKIAVLNPEQLAAARPIEFRVSVRAERDLFSGVVKVERAITWEGRQDGPAVLPEWKWQALISALRAAADDLEATLKGK